MNVFFGSLLEWVRGYVVIEMAVSSFMLLMHQIFPEGFCDDEGDVYDRVALYVLIALLGPFGAILLLLAFVGETLPEMSRSIDSIRIAKGLQKAGVYCDYLCNCLLDAFVGNWTDSAMERLGTLSRVIGPLTVPVLVLAIVTVTTMSLDSSTLAVVLPISDFYYRLD